MKFDYAELVLLNKLHSEFKTYKNVVNLSQQTVRLIPAEIDSNAFLVSCR
jgi:hypothetical protein